MNEINRGTPSTEKQIKISNLKSISVEELVYSKKKSQNSINSNCRGSYKYNSRRKRNVGNSNEYYKNLKNYISDREMTKRNLKKSRSREKDNSKEKIGREKRRYYSNLKERGNLTGDFSGKGSKENNKSRNSRRFKKLKIAK